MTTRRKVLLGIAVAYFASLFAAVLIFGFARNDNDEFAPQN